MWPLTVLTGDHINEGFSKAMYGRFARPRKSDCNNEVAVACEIPL